jgi:TatA/E family protein of Tat protein translocase
MPFGIGVQELLIVLVIALIVLGPKRLPEVGRSIGSGMREFRDSISGGKSAADEHDDFDVDVAAHRVEPTTPTK